MYLSPQFISFYYLSENIIKQVTGYEDIPDWAEKFSAGHLIDSDQIIEYMDFDESDMHRQKATVLHTNTEPHRIQSYEKTRFIRLELRVGQKQFSTIGSSWGFSNDVSALKNSDYFIDYSHKNGDKTYVKYLGV